MPNITPLSVLEGYSKEDSLRDQISNFFTDDFRGFFVDTPVTATVSGLALFTIIAILIYMSYRDKAKNNSGTGTLLFSSEPAPTAAQIGTSFPNLTPGSGQGSSLN